MIVFNICKLLYSLIQSFLGIIFVKINEFTFQVLDSELRETQTTNYFSVL